MSSQVALMRACCSTTPAETEQLKTTITSVGLAAPRILRAGEHVDFFAVPASPGNEDLWSKLNGERNRITTRVCYCSVFDECWLHLGGTDFLRQDPIKMIHPDRVDRCPTPATPYQGTS